MTSEAKRAANRANAQKSTDPRSREGKARASKNATRHGLTKTAVNYPAAQDRIAALATALAGEGASSAGRTQAAVVAEAQVDLNRARAARTHLQARRLDGVRDLRSEPEDAPGADIPRTSPASTATSAAPCRAAARPCNAWTSCAPLRPGPTPEPPRGRRKRVPQREGPSRWLASACPAALRSVPSRIPAAEGSSRRYDPMGQPAPSPIRRAEPHGTGSSQGPDDFRLRAAPSTSTGMPEAPRKPSAIASINPNGQPRNRHSFALRSESTRADFLIQGFIRSGGRASGDLAKRTQGEH